MKRKLIFAAILISLAGCLPSLHPLYTKDTTIFDPNILGTWKESDNTWKFEKSTSKDSYKLLLRMGKEESEFDAHLVKIGNKLFLDFFPGEPDINENDFYTFHLVPTHTFARVYDIDPNLVIGFMDSEKIVKMLKTDPNLIKHEFPEDYDGVVLTASTQELQKFAAKYADDPNVFKPGEPLIRVIGANEPAEPNTPDPNQ
ncbi:MAG: hypothetical protein PHF37_02730 [Phycisphaerae bacterium]|nr:hypothetical protein [Phycisphaerae bacterium]